MFSYLNGEGIVVMTNSTMGFHIYQELLASAASVYDWPDFRTEEHAIFPIGQEELDKFTGTYGSYIGVTHFGDALQCEVLANKSGCECMHPHQPIFLYWMPQTSLNSIPTT